MYRIHSKVYKKQILTLRGFNIYEKLIWNKATTTIILQDISRHPMTRQINKRAKELSD